MAYDNYVYRKARIERERQKFERRRMPRFSGGTDLIDAMLRDLSGRRFDLNRVMGAISGAHPLDGRENDELHGLLAELHEEVRDGIWGFAPLKGNFGAAVNPAPKISRPFDPDDGVV